MTTPSDEIDLNEQHRRDLGDEIKMLCQCFALYSLCNENRFYDDSARRSAMDKLSGLAKSVAKQIEQVAKIPDVPIPKAVLALINPVAEPTTKPLKKLRTKPATLNFIPPRNLRPADQQRKISVQNALTFLAEKQGAWLDQPLAHQEFYSTLHNASGAALDVERLNRWHVVDLDEYEAAISHCIETLPAARKLADVRSSLYSQLACIRCALDGTAHWYIRAAEVRACCYAAALLSKHAEIPRRKLKRALQLILADQENQMGNIWNETNIKSHEGTAEFHQALAELDIARLELCDVVCTALDERHQLVEAPPLSPPPESVPAMHKDAWKRHYYQLSYAKIGVLIGEGKKAVEVMAKTAAPIYGMSVIRSEREGNKKTNTIYVLIDWLHLRAKENGVLDEIGRDGVKVVLKRLWKPHKTRKP